jgi:ketosteroid isomerase-like protein
MTLDRVQLIRDWFDAFNRGEGEAFVAEHVHEESAVDEGTSGTFLPDAEVLHGPDGFWTSVRKGTDLFDDVEITMSECVEAEEAVMVGMRVTGRGKASGAPLDFVRYDVYRFRDGKIGEVALFAVRGEALEAAGLSPPE